MALPSASYTRNTIRRSLRAILDPDLTPAGRTQVWDYFGGCCAYCDVTIERASRRGHLDHLVAAADGGTNDMHNRVLACSTCNGDEKLGTPWDDFLRTKAPTEEAYRSRKTRIEAWAAMSVSSREVDELLLDQAATVALAAYDEAVRLLRESRHGQSRRSSGLVGAEETPDA